MSGRFPLRLEPAENLWSDGEAWPLPFPLFRLMFFHPPEDILQFRHGRAPEGVRVIPLYLQVADRRQINFNGAILQALLGKVRHKRTQHLLRHRQGVQDSLRTELQIPGFPAFVGPECRLGEALCKIEVNSCFQLLDVQSGR